MGAAGGIVGGVEELSGRRLRVPISVLNICRFEIEGLSIENTSKRKGNRIVKT
jgi:hypothetical protein